MDHVGEDAKPAAASTTGGWFTSLFNSGNGNGANGANGKGAHSLSLGREGKSAADALPAVRGLYMYGGVGCGKTMLMDVFVHTAPAHFRVLRTHFHDFMLEVHAALRKHSREADPLLAVADGIAARCRVLALDELFVTDVADAMILNRWGAAEGGAVGTGQACGREAPKRVDSVHGNAQANRSCVRVG